MEQPNTKQCWECRRRRLVCDFTRPKCRKCQARGVACTGYDSKPLRWLHPQQVNAKGPEKTVVPRTVKPAEDSRMSAVLEAIEYCKAAPFFISGANALILTRQCAYRTRLGRDGVQRSRKPLLDAAVHCSPAPPVHQSEYCVHVTVPPHIAVERCGPSRPSRPSSATPTAPGRRLTGSDSRPCPGGTSDLRCDPGGSSSASHGRGRSTTIVSCKVSSHLSRQIQQSFEPPNWQHHINGATTLIGMKGGLGHLVFSRPYLCHLFRYYAL